MHFIFKKADFVNTAWFLSEKLIQVIIGAFIVPKIFVSLGATNMGDLKYVITIVSIFTPIFSLGLMDISIREIIYHPKRTNAIMSTSLFLQLGSWFLIFVGLLTYLIIIEEKGLFALYIIIAFSYLTRLGNIAEYYFLATKKVKFIFIAKISSLLIITLLQYYGVQSNYGIAYFAKITVFDFLFQGMIYLLVFTFNKSINIRLTRFSFPLAKSLLKSSYPLIITQFLLYIYISLDKIFIKHYLNSEAIGHFYSVKFLVITLTWSFGFAIINALYPAIAKSYNTNKKEYAKKMLFLLKIVSVYGVVIAVFFNMTGSYILKTYFNDAQEDTFQALKIFSWAPLIIFIGMIYEKHIINNNKLYKDAIRFAIGIIVNVLLSIVLIPKYGIPGAAVSILMSHFAVNIAYVFIDAESRKQLIYFFSNR